MNWGFDLSSNHPLTQVFRMFRVDYGGPGVTILLTFALSLILLLIQRSEPKKRRIVVVLSLVALELIRRFVWYRDIHSEALTALAIALFLNAFYYLFIGRYNPVPTSDAIQVIGMND